MKIKTFALSLGLTIALTTNLLAYDSDIIALIKDSRPELLYKALSKKIIPQEEMVYYHQVANAAFTNQKIKYIINYFKNNIYPLGTYTEAIKALACGLIATPFTFSAYVNYPRYQLYREYLYIALGSIIFSSLTAHYALKSYDQFMKARSYEQIYFDSVEVLDVLSRADSLKNNISS